MWKIKIHVLCLPVRVPIWLEQMLGCVLKGTEQMLGSTLASLVECSGLPSAGQSLEVLVPHGEFEGLGRRRFMGYKNNVCE